jgi:hypothetical protein
MPDQIRSLKPILCAPILRKVDAELIELLASLAPGDWDLQTVAPAWKVRDVAAHLLDTPLRKLSMEWFKPDGFANPASPFTPGTAPVHMNHVRTMGGDDLDLSLYESFPMGEQRNLRFEISSYNVANKPQLGYPNVPSYTSGWVNNGFGLITNTIDTPRQFQFGSRLTF